MRLTLGAALVLGPVAVALAQTPTPVPLPAPRPPVVQTPSAQAPVAVPMPPPAAAQPPAAPGAVGQAAPGTPPDTVPPPPPPAWLPVGVADILALDKVTARATRLTVRVGQTVPFGSLSIALRACDIRPADQPADSAALLDIADSHPGAPEFHGWMLVSAPSVSMLEHPIYDIRLAGCHA